MRDYDGSPCRAALRLDFGPDGSFLATAAGQARPSGCTRCVDELLDLARRRVIGPLTTAVCLRLVPPEDCSG